jgi:hypothetical protein
MDVLRDGSTCAPSCSDKKKVKNKGYNFMALITTLHLNTYVQS